MNGHESTTQGSTRQFEVRVGLATVVVEAPDEDAALQLGRRQLLLEYPRLWDVIQGLDDDRFEVSGIEGIRGQGSGISR